MGHAYLFRGGPYSQLRPVRKRAWYKRAMPPLSLLCSPLLSEHGFRHGFSPRQGGVSQGVFAGCNVGRAVGDQPEHVEQNRQRFATAVGYAAAELFELSQVHGRVVRCVEAGDEPASVRSEEGDGLIAPGQAGAQGAHGGPGASSAVLALGVRTADCVPLLLADPHTRSVAALHSGWRGTALDIAGEGVRRLCARASAAPERLIAAVFPHIRACCFEVSPEVADALQAAAPTGSVVTQRVLPALPGQPDAPAASPKPHVDLLAIVRAQLAAAGLSAARIDVAPGCTRCEPERFFSYRRDGQASGRHLTAIIAG
jgi:polyphenol oxidase